MSREDLYAGIKEYKDYHSDLIEGCEVVVVGSGPTGALVAYNLAEAGIDTILLETGPVRRPADFSRDGGKLLCEATFEQGMRVLGGSSIMPTIQGRVLGGGSHINSAMCVRTPQFCFDEWGEKFCVESITRDSLDPHYDRIEKFLGIRPTEEGSFGRKNELFKKACDELGYSSMPSPRNVVGCDGCAECFTGCPTRAKRSTDITYVPEGIKKGLRVYTSIRAEKVIHFNGRAEGITGSVVHPKTNKPSHKVKINSRAVVLAAGCLATPVILQKSNVDDPHNQIGSDLQAHPGVAMLGVFDNEVNPWVGATQGYQSLQFLEEGFKLEVLWAPPAILSVRLPGAGAEFKSNLAAFKYGAVWDAFCSPKKATGSVRPRPGNSYYPSAKYHIDNSEMPLIRKALATIMEMFFAAGAKKVLPGIHGMPPIVTDRKAIGDLLTRQIKPTDLVLASTHLFSTTKMGPDPTGGVVDQTGEMFNLKNCYIADTGVMPKSPAVNPMLTGMALADLFSATIIDRHAKPTKSE